MAECIVLDEDVEARTSGLLSLLVTHTLLTWASRSHMAMGLVDNVMLDMLVDGMDGVGAKEVAGL
eukprot:3070458-Amphidinium_carterae.2